MRVIAVLAASIVLIASLAGCASTTRSAVEPNKALVQAFTEATNDADWTALERLLADDFRRHSAATAGPPVTSREEFVALQKGFLESFPDQRVEVERMVAEGDHVAILATYTGTQSGPMGPLPASGKSVRSPFLGLFRIDSGRIAELWVEWDNLALLAQLGHAAAPPADP